jgi:hypothetical protein
VGDNATDALENPAWFTVCGIAKDQLWLEGTLFLIACCSFAFVILGLCDARRQSAMMVSSGSTGKVKKE